MELEIILGVTCVILLGMTIWLSMGRLEKLQVIRKLEEETNDARRTSQQASKKLDDHQSRYDKAKTELAKAQQQEEMRKDLLQKVLSPEAQERLARIEETLRDVAARP